MPVDHGEEGFGRATVPPSAGNTRSWRALLLGGLGNERTVRLKAEEYGSDGNQTRHL